MSKKSIIVSFSIIILISICIFIYTVVTSKNLQEIDNKLTSNVNIIDYTQSINNVTISIETLSNEQVKIKLTSDNQFVYSSSSGEFYKLYCMNDNEWKELRTIGSYDTTEVIIYRPKTKDLSLTKDWSKKYGKLQKGKYKLEDEFGIDEIFEVFSIEFEII